MPARLIGIARSSEVNLKETHNQHYRVELRALPALSRFTG
jgi:hypothetical protein